MAQKRRNSLFPNSEVGSAAVSETSSGVGSQAAPEEGKKVVNEAYENTEELSREELGRLVASRWTGEKTKKQSGESDSKDTNHEEHEEILEDNYDEEEDSYATDTDDDSERYDDTEKHDNDMEDETYREKDHDDSGTSYTSYLDDKLDSSETTYPSNPSWLEKQKKIRRILQAVNLFQTPVDKSEAACVHKEYDESSDKLSKIQSRISSLKQKLKHDFGPEKEFYSLYGCCFESKQNKYVYKVCPYKKATQEEGYSTTRLGGWDKFEDSYHAMLFSNGDKCWNGPDRSMKVRLRCGLKNEIIDVDEPSRCEYVALLSTPVVCLEEKLQERQHKLDTMNKEQPQGHDEF